LSKVLPFVPGVNIANDASIAFTGKDLTGYYKNENEIQAAKLSTFVTGMSAGIAGGVNQIIKAGNAELNSLKSVIELEEQTLTKGNFAGRGSSAKLPVSSVEPSNLKEQIALKEVLSNPYKGSPVPIKKGMTDIRWPQAEGWVKYYQTNNGTEIHYLWNKTLNLFDDFKIIKIK
jgi:hypothetical protein